jgi:hypothetical protein
MEVVAIERPRTIIRPPSAGLAPTIQSEDSATWAPEPRTRRWQWALGATALVLATLMFIVTRSGDAQEAEAATTPPVPSAFSAGTVSDQPDAIAVQEQPGAAQALEIAPVAPPAATPTVAPTKTPPRTNRGHRTPTRKAPAAPRRDRAPIDPNGTIEPW